MYGHRTRNWVSHLFLTIVEVQTPFCVHMAGTEDLDDITSYLHELDRTAVCNLGLVLGLHYKRLQDMMDSPAFLQDMLAAWLQMVDKVQRAGIPSWNRLAEALRDPRVGQNGIATKIEHDKQTAS